MIQFVFQKEKCFFIDVVVFFLFTVTTTTTIVNQHPQTVGTEDFVGVKFYCPPALDDGN